MTAAGEALAIRRILVALETSSRSLAALETAAELAAGLRAPLLALFVEDINLLHLAALPFAREVGYASAAERRLDAPAIQRLFRLQSAQAQRSLAETAARLQIEWSFRITRGLPVPSLLEMAEAADLLVFGKTGARRQAAAGPVVVVFDGSAGAHRALAAAAGLALAASRPLAVLLAAETREAFAPLREHAQAALKQGATRAAYLRLAQRTARALAQAVAETGAGALVLPAESPPWRPAEIRALLDQIDCPLVLVRG